MFLKHVKILCSDAQKPALSIEELVMIPTYNPICSGHGARYSEHNNAHSVQIESIQLKTFTFLESSVYL